MNPQELVDDVKEIKRILTELEKRKVPATAEQLEAINQRPVVINPEKFAAYVSTALVKALEDELPNMENIKAAANTAVVAIDVAGVTAAQRIEKAARQQADVLASRIGFTSWQSALFIFSMFLLLVVGSMLANQQREADLAQARSETQGVRAFTEWVKKQPSGKRLYERYYNP